MTCSKWPLFWTLTSLLSAHGHGQTFSLIFQDDFEDGVGHRWTAVVPSDSWTQHAKDAQHTSYSKVSVPLPWRWRWAWNGPDSTGGIIAGKTSLPRNVQPVVGSGLVFVARGALGVVALSARDGSVVWSRSFAGEALATPAYDRSRNSLYFGTTAGELLRLEATTGATLANASTGGRIDLPVTLGGGLLVVAAGSRFIAYHPDTLSLRWSYEAGSLIETPAAFSPAMDRWIVGTLDLFVHAVDSASGSRIWRVKPTPNTPSPDHSYRWGWPVIADAHGLVLVKMRLPWQAMWSYGTPGTNAQIRAHLVANPEEQCLFALRLENGSSAFVANVGHGGFGDNDYLPMGPQPVVKRFLDGKELAYVLVRGTDGRYDPRWDSNFGELLFDSTTVPGYQAGEVRWIRYPGMVDYLLTDEQPNLSMAGDHLFGGHWMAGYAIQITDRSAHLGSYLQPIESVALPHLVTSTNSIPFHPSHWDPDVLAQDGDSRLFPFGFYIFWNQGAVYDEYWSEYAVWVVSDGLVFFRSTDGTIVCLEAGDPLFGYPPQAMTFKRQEDFNVEWVGSFVSPNRKSDRPLPLKASQKEAGLSVTIEGIVQTVHFNGKELLLGFARPHSGHPKILIPAHAFENFRGKLRGELGRNRAGLFKEGQRIRAIGAWSWYQGDPVLRIEDPQTIRILGPGNPNPGAARSPG